MTKGLTPQLFKAALGLLGMSLKEFCSESSVSLTRMSEFQNNPDTRLTNTTVQKIVYFAQNKGVKITEEGVTYIKRIEELYGIEGLKRLYDEVYGTLSGGGNLRVFDVPSEMMLEILGHEYLSAHVKRMANIGNNLVASSLVCMNEEMAIERPYMQYRLYQKEEHFKQSMLIFQDKVAFIKLDIQKPFIHLQRDVDMANMCSMLFDSNWENASDIDLHKSEASILYQTA